MKSTYPIPFNKIKHLSQATLKHKLLIRSEIHTQQFLYGMAWPVFNKLWHYFYTDCETTEEYANDTYIYIIEPRESKTPPVLLETYLPKKGKKLVHWLFKTALNRCIDEHRKHRNVVFVTLDENIAGYDDSRRSDIDRMTLSGEKVKDKSYYIETGLSKKEWLQLIAQIPNERYRKLLTYRYLENLKYSEVAAQMGESESLCRQTRYKAVEQLKTVFFANAENLLEGKTKKSKLLGYEQRQMPLLK